MVRTLKLSVACALLAVGGASAWSTSRSDFRHLGQKTIPTGSRRRVEASLKMESSYVLITGLFLNVYKNATSCMDLPLIDLSASLLPFARRSSMTHALRTGKVYQI